jgi:hypothetical protein
MADIIASGVSWNGHYLTLKNSLRILCDKGLAMVQIKYSASEQRYMYYYGVTPYGKAFVNYNEKN